MGTTTAVGWRRCNTSTSRKMVARLVANLTVTILLSFGYAAVACATQNVATAIPRNAQFSSIATESGLSGEFVHDIAQDGRGFIWFATQAGLTRFDGHEAFVYESVPDDPATLSHNFIWSLYVDPKGELWVGTDRGVNKYDVQSDSFKRDPLLGLRSNIRVRKIMQDKAGAFWIGSVGGGLIRIDPESHSPESFRHIPGDTRSLPNDHVIDIIEDSHGELWVGTDGGGLARFDRSAREFVSYRHDPDDKLSISGNQIRSIYEDSSGRLWIGTSQGGLNLMDRESGSFSRFQNDPNNELSLGGGQISAILEDDRGTLWVGTEQGLSEWRPTNNGFVHYQTNPADRTSIVANRINAIFQDASGVLWLATHAGVSSWNYFSDTFRYFSRNEGYLESNLVTSVAESSDGSIWVGTYGGGLSKIDITEDAVRFFRHKQDDASSLPDDRVMAVHVDFEDTVWVGTRDGGLAKLNDDGSGFTRFVHDEKDEQTLSGNAISNIFREPDGTLWVSAFDAGLNRLRPESWSKFERFSHNPNDSTTISSNRVLAVYQDSGGSVWFGTEGAGLNRFISAQEGFERYSLGDEEPGRNEQQSWTPWGLHESEDGTMWIATLSRGLLRWGLEDRRNRNLRLDHFSTTEGLASQIFGVVESTPGQLWLSSSRGLFLFEPETRSVRKFDLNNGLRTNEFNQGANLRSRSGRVVFGSNEGLVGFFPGELPSNNRPPSIELSARSRTENIARTGSGRAVPTIELQYFNAFVSFGFVALDFVSPDKNKYRYRLKGLEQEWTEVNKFRQAI